MSSAASLPCSFFHRLYIKPRLRWTEDDRIVSPPSGTIAAPASAALTTSSSDELASGSVFQKLASVPRRAKTLRPRIVPASFATTSRLAWFLNSRISSVNRSTSALIIGTETRARQ